MISLRLYTTCIYFVNSVECLCLPNFYTYNITTSIVYLIDDNSLQFQYVMLYSLANFSILHNIACFSSNVAKAYCTDDRQSFMSCSRSKPNVELAISYS